MDVTINLDKFDKILNVRGLNRGGKAQQYMATNLLRIFDGYTPLRAGVLKGSAYARLTNPYVTIVYDMPYAKSMYYNPQYNFNESPRRGAYWDKRAWADQKSTFLKEFETLINSGKFQ